MKNLLTVARFEWHYHRHRSATYLFAGLVFGQGCWQVGNAARHYAGTDPATLVYFALSSLGVLPAVVCVLLAGQSLTKDQEFRAGAYLYSLPITSRSFFAGRFLGTLLTALTVAVFYPLGVLAALLYQHPTAPVPWLALVDGFARLLTENVFIVVSVAFSLTVLLHGIRGAYLSLLLVVLYFLLTETQTDGLTDSDLWQLLDPFGVGMVRASIDAMATSAGDKPGLELSDMLLINRLLWLGLAAGLLAQAEAAFSFRAFGQPGPDKRRPTTDRQVPRDTSSRPIRLSFGGGPRIRLLGGLVRLHFLTLVRQPFFLSVVGLLVLLTVLLATVFGQNGNFPPLPLTSSMTALRLPMGAFISLFLLIMTGELLFQERTVGLSPIIDALPQPAFVGITAKLLALAGLALLLTITLFLTGVAIQLSAGFRDVDWSLYALDLTIDGFLRYCQLIALGAFVAAVVNNRVTSHVINLLFFGLLWSAWQFGPMSVRPYLYSFLPGSDQYSNLTGYGVNGPLRLPTHLLWWTLAGLMTMLAVSVWNRGIPVGLLHRLRAGQQRVGGAYRLALLLAVAGFIGCIWRVDRISGLPPATLRADRQLQTRVDSVRSVSGRFVSVRVLYHDGYQVRAILNAARRALRRGEQLFGPYPQSALQIVEMPHGLQPVRSGPGRLLLSENEGWTADNRHPANLDYLDYLISREVFNQWLTHRMHPLPQPGDGFLRRSLADYLALCVVGERYGPGRLKQRLAERSVLYATSRNRATKPEVTLLQSRGNDGLERGRAALMLSSIGQVWNDAALSQTIGQFYRLAVRQPTSATVTAFAAHLNRQLPDSLRYLTGYLTDRLWFSFSIGRIANLPNGLSVEVFPKKWSDDNAGNRQSLPINDLIPLTVFDRDDQPIYTALVRPEPDERWIRLPALTNAAAVQIDPLGTWPELVKRDNYKIF